MKLKIFTLLCLSLFTGLKSFASHAIGGEISYLAVAPYVYVVTFKGYSDCNGVAPATTETLSLKSAGCMPPRTFTMNLLGSQLGSLYGPNGPVGCSSAAFNYFKNTYLVPVTFSVMDTICPEWIFSVNQTARIPAANLAQMGATSNMYTESRINIFENQNNSPEFDVINPVIPIVPVNQPVLLSMSATDPDGDSLAYELVSALNDYNVPVQYAAIYNPQTLPPFASMPAINPATGECTVINNQVSPSCLAMYRSGPFDTRNLPYQTAILPMGFCTAAGTGFPTQFSGTYPMPSYYPVDWLTNCPTNVPFGPYFKLDPQNGTLEFKPNYFNPSTAPYANHYAVSVKVSQWRRTGNYVRYLGSVRRETIIIVGPVSSNLSPRLIPGPAGLVVQKAFVVTPGSTLNYTFLSSDNNASDSVQMISNATANLPGATFSTSQARLQSGTVNWTPTAAQARSQPYYFNLVLRDNANLRGYTVETIKVDVRSSGVTSVKEEAANNLALTAFPNPFSDEVSFKLNLKTQTKGTLIIYNILGRETDRIELANLPAGEQTITWRNAPKMAPGSYMARFVGSNNQSQSIKFLKLK